jgi:hypothetical protein
MTDQDDDPEEFIPLQHVAVYHSVVFQLQNFIAEFAHRLGSCDRNEDWEHSQECFAAKRAYEHGHVLSSAISLEALINYYGKVRGVCYHRDLEKNMSSLNKWRLYPRLAGGHPIGEHLLDRIDVCFKIRDRIAHPKPKVHKRTDRIKPFFPNHGFYLLNTVHQAARALELDHHESERWTRPDYQEEQRPPPDVYV